MTAVKTLINLHGSLFRYNSQVVVGLFASVAKKSAVSSLDATRLHIQMQNNFSEFWKISLQQFSEITKL
jgi:hypothetical protein